MIYDFKNYFLWKNLNYCIFIIKTLFLTKNETNMKTLIFVFLIILCSSMNGFSQNRIHGWEIEKITSIQVEFTSPINEIEIQILNTKQDIDKIISFLKNVEFRELGGSDIYAQEQTNNWRCKIIFQGQRDQVFLFQNSACIGKTTFLIDSNVIGDFRNLIEELKINIQHH